MTTVVIIAIIEILLKLYYVSIGNLWFNNYTRPDYTDHSSDQNFHLWCVENNALFIEVVQEYECLNNRTSCDYKDKCQKMNAWTNVVVIFEVMVEKAKLNEGSDRSEFCEKYDCCEEISLLFCLEK